jgi:hypothetical protein
MLVESTWLYALYDFERRKLPETRTPKRLGKENVFYPAPRIFPLTMSANREVSFRALRAAGDNTQDYSCRS